MRAVPSVGIMKPASIRIVVDLPAPLGPRKPTTSPRRDGEGDVIDGGESAEAFGQPLDFDQNGAG